MGRCGADDPDHAQPPSARKSSRTHFLIYLTTQRKGRSLRSGNTARGVGHKRRGSLCDTGGLTLHTASSSLTAHSITALTNANTYYPLLHISLHVATRHVNRSSFYSGSTIAFLVTTPDVSTINIAPERVAAGNSKRPTCTRASTNI